MKKTIRMATFSPVVAVAALIPFAASAVEIKLSGQVNRLMMGIDNGDESGVVHADNSTSGTRFRFTGTGDLQDGMTAGVAYETQLQSNPSDKIDADNIDSDGVGGNVGDGDYFSNRIAQVWIKGNFGKVTMGQGSGATDGSAEIDDSGTAVIQYSAADGDLLGSMAFGESGVVVKDVRNNFDGLGRNDNLRYDAGIGDFNLAASYGNGDKKEASVLYSTDKFKAKLGIWDEDDSGGGHSGAAVSATWSADNGFNVTGAYSGDDRKDDPRNAYVKLGYKTGIHAFGIDYSETTDLGPGDSQSYSIGWVGSMMQGLELYASLRRQTIDDVSDDDDIDAVAAGARIKF